jgi:diadenosine tetraphosphatase ApaH/serine/threonine PP2A family protein phosphatase
LGDLVGYNANPNECLELIRSRGIISVAGNHDRAVVDPRLAQDFNIIAHQAIIWATGEIADFHKDFLQQLPIVQVIDQQYLACHGTPSSPESYISYHFQGKRVLNQLRRELNLPVCFFGHTHKRALWYRDIRGKVALMPLKAEKFFLERDSFYLINPGSVGQPRNQIPSAAYAIFDTVEHSVHFKLVAYDIPKAQSKIMAANLHPYLAERLAQGV